MKTRLHDAKRLVLAALRCHGPLSDAQLAWWLEHFGVKPGTAKKTRWQLARDGKVRYAPKVRRTSAGRLQQMWELSPNP